MRKRGLLRLGQAGDTIVEVLLAIAVVSSVLGGAFVSANRSLRGTQVSSERGEALKLVEGQLESLKAALKDKTKADLIYLPATGDFCLDGNADVEANVSLATCNVGPAGRYGLAINRSNTDTFTASATWDKIGGSNQPETVSIVYRAHRP